MKRLLALLFLTACFTCGFSQDNPYAVFGYKSDVKYVDSREDVYRIKNADTTTEVKAFEFDFGMHAVRLLNKKDSVLQTVKINDDKMHRFLSVDPYTAKYPQLTPYQFASNTPIQAVDVDGLERFYYAIAFNKNNRAYLVPTRTEDIIDHTLTFTSSAPFVKMVEEVNKRQEFVVQGPVTRSWDNFGNNTFYQDEDQLTFSTLSEAKKHVAANNGLGYVYNFWHQLGQAARYQREEEEGGSGVLGRISSPGEEFSEAAHSLSSLPEIETARWSQTDYSETFSKRGKFSGSTIDDIVAKLRSGQLSSSEVTVDVIVRNGQTLILNTRSTVALTRAGVPRSQWNYIDRTGEQFYENNLNNQLKGSGLNNSGTPSVKSRGTGAVTEMPDD